MDELLRIRRLMDLKGASDMSNWKLLKSATIEEETNSINIDFDDEYEELNILLLSCGTAGNNAVNNANASIIFASSSKNTVRLVINGLMMKNEAKRIFQIESKLEPYFNSTYKCINSDNFEKASIGNYFGQGGCFSRQFNEKIHSIKIAPDNSNMAFGIGTKYAIYGK